MAGMVGQLLVPLLIAYFFQKAAKTTIGKIAVFFGTIVVVVYLMILGEQQ